MRKSLLLATAFVVFLSAWTAAQRGNPIHKRQISSNLLTTNNFGGDGPNNSTGTSGTGANIDVIYHRIFWRVNPDSATKYIKGWVMFKFKTIQASVSTITFDLNATHSIDSIRYNNTKVAVGNITRSGNIVTLSLGTTLGNNVIDSFTVYYGGTPPAVDNPPGAVGYQKTSDANAGNYIYTLSESYEDRDWWPCKADMQDKIDSMDITVSVPWAATAAADTFWAAVNGKMVDSTVFTGSGATSSRQFSFKTRYPIPSYLVSLCVAKFSRYYRSVNINGTIVPVVYNLFKGKSAGTYTSMLTKLDSMNLALSAFSNKFGDYPFKNEKHGFYEFGFSGGMEHQTFSGMSTGSMTSSSVLSHELMHQWFGDNVTFGTWNDLWLAEGFASYGEALYYEIVANKPVSAFYNRATNKSNALAQTVSAWIPNASCNTSGLWNSSYGSSVYDRGGVVVSMLRALSGDNKFFTALTNYGQGRAKSSATTDTLRNYFNAQLGMNIDPFFKDYVGGSGTGTTAVGGVGNPINPVNWNVSGNRLVLQMGTQTKSATNNVTYFRGPVVVRFTAPGKDTTITFFDWSNGRLSYAGNGLSDSIPGNTLYYDLSFAPTAAVYDDSARTLSTGSMSKTATGYTWTGATNSNWTTASNWAGGVVPPNKAVVAIATTGSAPVLTSNVTVSGLFMNAGTKISLGTGTLTINGPITGSATIIGSTTGNIVINGLAGSHSFANTNVGTLNFDQTSAATRSVNSITINAGASVKLGTAVDVYGDITLNSASMDFNGQNVTLKSTATGTARIGNLTGSTITNATNVTVERYISDVGRRSWRLLAVPVTGTQTIKQAWQENGVNNANLGTNISSNLYNGTNGFDMTSTSASILTHNQGGLSGPSWNYNLANTNTTLLSDYPAYMLYVRGDRNALPGNSLHAPTVLRATGTIRQGTQSAVTVSATGTGYTLVGNPYASPVDFETIAGTTNLNQNFYVWDPTLTGNYGAGGYKLVQRTAPNTYQVTPVVLGGTTSDPTARYIHSGQAFFLKATGANASVVFTEASKASSVSVVNPIVNTPTGGDQQLIANLLQVDVNGNASLNDGFRVMFNDNYSAGINDDINKIGNFGENLSSLREGKSFIVENRPMIAAHDTIFMRMTNTTVNKYRLQIGTQDFVQAGVTAKLQDDYLGTSSPIDLSGAVNEFDFSVTADPASAAATRFKIIFGMSAPLPVSFTSVKAYQQNSGIAVEWKVANQTNIKNYEIEKSTNGTTFIAVATQAAIGTSGADAAYNWFDANPVAGNNYYRIRSVANSGDTRYSEIVNVKISKEDAAFTVSPNPVLNHTIVLQFTAAEKGTYQLKLVNTAGQVMLTQTVMHHGGSAAQSLALAPSVPGGYYRLEIIRPDNTKAVKSVYISE